MTSIQFVIQPLPGTDEQYIERLREVSEKVNKYGFSTHRIFDQLKIPVKEVVIGPSHIGVLLEDGKAFRVSFSINSERLDLSKGDLTKNATNNSSHAGPSKNTAPSRQLARSRARLMRTTARSAAGGQGSGSRSTGVIIGGSSANRPSLVTVTAPFVPEELISQAEVVLQGKSRNLIIRELQRTNLDVNLAVNNLLSRDDEEGDDIEEGGDNYVPEDLISLLDNGFHGDNNSVIIDPADGLFSEEIFSNYSSIRNLLFDRIRSERSQSNSGGADNTQSRPPTSTSGVLSGTNSLSAQIPPGLADREAFSRWRDRPYYGPRRWINKDEYVWDKDPETKKKESSTMTSPVWVSEEIQPWPDKNNTVRFKKIAALYSEFIAVTENGELHQWKWTENEPFRSDVENVYHPKTQSLNITEKIEHISANFIRASIVTESYRVATWMDEQLGYLGSKLEHSSIAFSEFIMDPIISVNVCSLYTAVRTESNNVYWWGVLPFDQRRYLWDKFQTKNKKPFKATTSDITVGTQVVMRKCPIYQAGSIGFACANGVPKVGQLLNSVWDFNDVCRFKILNLHMISSNEKSISIGGLVNSMVTETKETSKSTVISSANLQTLSTTKSNSANKETTDRIDMPPPPSPASSTCSDTGSVTSHKRNKRMAAKDDCNESKNDEELWQLKDVVFVEDKIGPIGKVLKVDGDFLAVRFPISNQSPTVLSGNNVDGKDDDWQQCRLLRREDVQVYKTAMNSRGPDWLQKLPKKINISHGSDTSALQLLSMAVDTRGIHVIKKLGSKLHYSLYNLYNSKQEQNCQFPTDSSAFMGMSINNISMVCNNDSNGNASTMVLRDGNRALYPIAKDCLNSIKDPHWFNLPPVKTVAMTTISLASNMGNNLKSKVCMTALVFEPQKLMPHILRCDVKSSFALLSLLDKQDKTEVLAVLDERCDGARNIFHACAVMCSPTSNKDSEEKDKKNVLPGLTARSASTGFVNTTPSNSVDNVASSSNSANIANSTFTAMSSNIPGPTSLGREGRTVSLREMMNRLINNDTADQPTNSGNSNVATAAMEDHFYLSSWPVDSTSYQNSATNDSTGGTDEDLSKIAAATSCATNALGKNNTINFVFDPTQRREQAALILQQMCSSTALRPYLSQMLSAKDAQGQTPFMLAVSSRAYDAGLILLSTILNITDKDQTIQKESMIFPAGSPPDQSPLHVICYNDTCSFTWTGADHINQNIFECKTCGLTGSLCCCTECAKVCHKGHDCKLKRTSPTAYCDCWEKCKCKALIAGNQQKRYALLCKLASTTDLVTKFNSKGESILLFLIQTVGRQTIEQRQYRANSRVRNVGNSANATAASSSRKTSTTEADTDMPEHDLEPPKFARRALERLLVDWLAVKSMIMTGAEKCEDTPQQTPNSSEGAIAESFNVYLQQQNGSTLLDKFTHNLFVKCSSEHLDTLLMTLVHEMQNDFVEGRMVEAEIVARRFVRSVARVFVIFSLEKLPNPEKRKSALPPNKHIQNCIKVFQNLHKISIQELCEVSEALIAPVRLGVLRPTAPFAMSSSNIDGSDDLFSVDPLAPSSSSESIEPVHGNIRGESVPGFNLSSNYAMDGIIGLREAPESEETINRENTSNGPEEDILEPIRNDEVMQDEESDNDFTFNDAETDSDSDDNQSNQDAQRSIQTRVTGGSETDDSGDSSPHDEEASEDGETDEHSDEFNFADHQLERRNVNSVTRNELAPQSMQWAIRGRDAFRSTVRVPPGSSLVFIDPMALRRSTVPSNSTVATSSQEPHTIATTASNLARAFGIILRQISELLSNLSYNLMNGIELPLKIDIEDAVELQAFAETRLKPTWDWLFSVMDSTEAQLKFGAYLTNYTDPTHPLHPLNLSAQSNMNQATTTSSVGINLLSASSRREFFTYCLSLMRAHTSEHRDALPVLDVSALRHIAYVLDGFIYYMRNDTFFYEKGDFVPSSIASVSNENYDTDDELSNITSDDNFIDSTPSCSTSSRRHSLFFSRSDSTLSLGFLAPDGFDLPLDVSIPLADKPHLLQPNSKREDLFANLPVISTQNYNLDGPTSFFNRSPTQLGFSRCNCCSSRNNVPKRSSSKDDLIETPSTSSGIAISSNKNKCNTDQSANVYLQFKKKQYPDEAKTPTHVVNDESTHKSETDHMETDDEESKNSVFGIPAMTTRPEVIVTPNKTQKREKNETPDMAVRSVIVRAHFSPSQTADCLSTDKKCFQPNETANTCLKNSMVLFPARGYHFCSAVASSDSPPWNKLIGRWKLALDLFGRVFMDDVGMENGSVLPELRGFPVKEIRFRRHMEKLRNGQQRDLILSKLERNRDSLIIQTFKELNTQFGSQNRRVHPPLAFNRVKVTFKDEPGEGSGVARSFYTSISEALLASAKMPNLESVQVGNNSKYGVPFSSILRNRATSGRDPPALQRRGNGSKILWRTARERKSLNYDARPFISSVNNSSDNIAENPNDHLSVHMQQLGDRLYPRVYSIHPANASKITGMLLEIPTAQLLTILSSDETLRQKINEAIEIITHKQKGESSTGSSPSQAKKLCPVVLLEQCQVEDNEPLFYSPGKRGFYTPRQGYGSFDRLNAFRNIGRLIGLCLQQNELLPIFLQRHVIKYILGRKVKFHDLAFFDPAIYESFRQLLHNSRTEGCEEMFNRMEIFFVIDLMKEEGGGSIELIPGGKDVQVNSTNVFEYIRRYTEYRLIKSQEKALEALKDGVFDVLPDSCLNCLTAEDFRLLLNGVGDINVSTLISYTTFNDESSEGSDKLLKFKRWFWSIVEKMNTLERQDLVYFWTGSPALPASEEGFQPLPSVTIRPADDTHLPTANTCISRLYIPLYSSKSILRSKLLLAIKSKNFGFV